MKWNMSTLLFRLCGNLPNNSTQQVNPLTNAHHTIEDRPTTSRSNLAPNHTVQGNTNSSIIHNESTQTLGWAHIPEHAIVNIFLKLPAESQIALGQTSKEMMRLLYSLSHFNDSINFARTLPLQPKHKGLYDYYLSRINQDTYFHAIPQDEKQTKALLATQRNITARSNLNLNTNTCKSTTIIPKSEQDYASSFDAEFSTQGTGVAIFSPYYERASVWDVHNMIPISIQPWQPYTRISLLAFSPDVGRISICNMSRKIKIWDINAVPATYIEVEGPRYGAQSLNFSHRGDKLLVRSIFGAFQIWDITTNPPKQIMHREDDTDRKNNYVAFSANGEKVVFESSNGKPQICDITGERPKVTELEMIKNSVILSILASNGNRLLIASQDCTAQIWDITTDPPTSIRQLTHEKPIQYAKFSPKGDKVFTIIDSVKLYIWNLTTQPATFRQLWFNGSRIKSVRFSPDGNRIILNNENQQAKVWDVTTDPPTLLHQSLHPIVGFSRCGNIYLAANTNEPNYFRILDFSTDAYQLNRFLSRTDNDI